MSSNKEIKNTKDYSIFKKNMLNRDIDPGNLKKITASLKARNLLQFRPILVNENFEVVDGQHRLEAAKQLGIDVYYQIQKDGTEEDILLLNSCQKNWHLDDYLSFYIAKSKEEYLKLRQFMNKNSLKLAYCLQLFNQNGGRNGVIFRAGAYKFPANLSDTNDQLLYVKHIQEFLNQKIIGNRTFIYTGTFLKAIVSFLNIKEVDRDIFLKKLEYKLEWVRNCTRYTDYRELFKNIYNYKNPNPINLKSDQ
jgi:hypothetical protein